MICQDCDVEAETKYVSFHQKIGALFMRFPKSVEGRLCKSCIHKHFWGMSTTTLFLGWWGTISFIVTPFFLLNNIARYLFCLGMAPVGPDASPPRMTDEAIERIQPHLPDLVSRLNSGEEFTAVAASIAERAGVTPGQVTLYLQALAQSQAQE